MTRLWSIDELPNMSAQEVFDRSVLHVLKNGTPSMQDGTCRYGGIGCGAAPFLKPSARRFADAAGQSEVNDYSSLWPNLTNGGRVTVVHSDLISALQQAHDLAAPFPEDNIKFIRDYVTKVKSVAAQFNLSVQHLNLPSV